MNTKSLFTRSFLLYLSSNTVNFIGSGIQGIALPWLLLQMTKSPLAVGIMLCVRSLPGIFLATYSGAIADRVDRRLICFWMSIMQGAAILSIVVLGYYHEVHQYFIYGMTLLLAVGNTFFFPAIRAYVQDVVGKNRLMKANSLSESTSQIGNMIGTGASGILVAMFGAVNTLLVGAITFFLSALCVIMMEKRTQVQGKVTSSFNIVRSFADIFKYMNSKHLLLGSTLFLLIPSLYIQVANVLSGAFVMNVLKLSSSAFGFISLSYSLGAMISGLMVASFAKKQTNNPTFIFLFMLALSIDQGLFGQTSNLAMAMVATFLMGCLLVTCRTWLNTKVMENSESSYAGRVQSVVNLLNSLMTLVSGVIIGGFVEKVGYPVMFLLIGCTGVLSAFWALLFYSRKTNSTTSHSIRSM